MMSERCAICHEDNQLRTLCDLHAWLKPISELVHAGGWSDWPLPDGVGPFVSQHHMLTCATAEPTPWQAVILATLTARGVWWQYVKPGGKVDTRESFGDGLAVYGLIDWRRINDEHGKAAA